MSRSDQEKLAELAGNSIRYVPAYALMIGSVKSGLMLSQLVYWHGMGKRYDGYFYKSVKEFEVETGMTRHEQDSAVRQLKSLGLIDVRLAGIPATRTFWVNIPTVQKMLTAWLRTSKLDSEKLQMQFAEKRQTNTDSTHRPQQKPP